MCQKKVVVLICARNEEKYIANTLKSVFNQTHVPQLVIVVDDGSRDSTPQILKQFQEKKSQLVVLRRKDRGFSAMGTPLIVTPYNTALKFLDDKKYDFLLIIGADTLLPSTYIEDLLQEMNRNPRLGILSGHAEGEYFSPEFPRGSGRLIRSAIVKRMRRFPLIHSWENYIVMLARAMGYSVKCHEKFVFRLQRPTGKDTGRHLAWGRGMRELGYHPLYVFGRAVKGFATGQWELATKLIVGYLTATYPKEVTVVRKYNSRYQKWYLPRLILRKLGLRRVLTS